MTNELDTIAFCVLKAQYTGTRIFSCVGVYGDYMIFCVIGLYFLRFQVYIFDELFLLARFDEKMSNI